MHAFIKEIFESIQGEALYIGEKQIFIRFCGCNLNCAYCDTDFEKENDFFVQNFVNRIENPISPQKLAQIVKEYSAKTVSLTGGEPLLYKDFLLEFLPLIKEKKIYLETNGTLDFELEEIINFVDIISMDIKLSSSTKQKNQFDKNKNFIKIAKTANKEIFAKIVLDKNYNKEELLEAIKITNEFSIPLIIQPMDCKDKSNMLDKNSLIELFDFVTQNAQNARLIPQTHKFLGLL